MSYYSDKIRENLSFDLNELYKRWDSLPFDVRMFFITIANYLDSQDEYIVSLQNQLKELKETQ